jgi:hypothetical protein
VRFWQEAAEGETAMKATQVQNGAKAPLPQSGYSGPTRPKWKRLAEYRKRKGVTGIERGPMVRFGQPIRREW